MNAQTKNPSRFDLWVSSLNRRDQAILNYGLWVISVLLVILAMAIVGHPHRTSTGNELPAGAVIQQGTVVTGQSPVDSFNEGVKIDTTQVSRG